MFLKFQDECYSFGFHNHSSLINNNSTVFLSIFDLYYTTYLINNISDFTTNFAENTYYQDIVNIGMYQMRRGRRDLDFWKDRKSMKSINNASTV